MWWFILFIVVWTVVSTAVLISRLGDKNKPGLPKYSLGWYWEAVFFAPTLVLAYIIGWLGRK